MDPTASRPDMAAYGVAAADEGAGLLPWSWAVDRLTASHEYWVATVAADGRPNVTPVWGVVLDEVVWFSCAVTSRKSRNLRARPVVTVTTDDPHQPVIVEGTARLVDDRPSIERFTTATNEKYESPTPVEFFLANDTWAVEAVTAFGLDDADFTGTPTRWRF